MKKNSSKASRSVKTQLDIFIDGASRGNPGPASAGVVLKRSHGISYHGYFLQETTNNVAEYMALVKALELTLTLTTHPPNAKITIYSDSELLVKQMTGEYRIKNATLKLLFEKAQKLAKQLPQWELKHIPREENKLADRVANKALDVQKDISW